MDMDSFCTENKAEILMWVRENLDIDEVFTKDELETWAVENLTGNDEDYKEYHRLNR